MVRNTLRLPSIPFQILRIPTRHHTSEKWCISSGDHHSKAGQLGVFSGMIVLISNEDYRLWGYIRVHLLLMPIKPFNRIPRKCSWLSYLPNLGTLKCVQMVQRFDMNFQE